MTSKVPSLRIAVVRNYDTPAQWGHDMIESWIVLARALVPDSTVEIYHPITDNIFPDAKQFNLIILTGGLFDLTLPDLDPWVAKTLDFIRKTGESCPGTKIAGICWGHQAICRAMGGIVGWNSSGDSVGVQTLKYTSHGRRFFVDMKGATGETTFALHKFHKRRVEAIPSGFIELAEDHEIILSENNRMIGFQGHPEMTENVAKGILDADDGAYTGGLSKGKIAEMYGSFQRRHDGAKMFERVIQWLEE